METFITIIKVITIISICISVYKFIKGHSNEKRSIFITTILSVISLTLSFLYGSSDGEIHIWVFTTFTCWLNFILTE